ncbi:ectonucleoside triphosphate diphosphohydrolase [Striga asiatica]|uniref:Ectonucleoside triphosphate diphosphohydrolase n=1 Tax=Striga asiatica TaxID=4170 RepID=A0A5A7RHV7_STRAF|nr:ectonucleoside triphosphate diphosphohydrolase [Striga asiatica]
METKSPSKSKLQNVGFTFSHNARYRKFVVAFVLIVLISGLGCYYFILKPRISMPEDNMSTYFSVVIDCGSTGSRVSVFEWMINDKSKTHEGLPVLLRSYPDSVNKSNGCEYHCMQTEPGLHNFINDESGVRASLEPLIRYAEKRVPLGRRYKTPIFVLATAGMRSLLPENTRRILQNVENVVQRHGFMYKKSWIRVLSGKEEAYYGWVALNYKMGIFRSSSRLSSTLGLLDLGGSSLQIVAEVDSSTGDNEHSFRSKIGPFEHDIVTYSLPAFGLNEAFDRTVIMLSHTRALGENSNGMFEIKHPCLSSGFIRNYTCRGCFGVDNSRKSSELNSVFLVGEPNWEECEVIARAAAINSSSLEISSLKKYHSDCMGLFSYGGNTEHNITKNLHAVLRYHALSGFFAVYHAMNLSRSANLNMIWEIGEKLCSSRLSSEQESVNGQLCFRVPYLMSLIENALCLGGAYITFGPGNVSWTLGASLIEGEFLWLHAGKSQHHILTWGNSLIIVPSSPLLIFVLLSSLLLIVYCCQIKLPKT